MEYKRLFIAVDGSIESDLALKKAISISKRNNHAKIYLIHVVDKSGRAHIVEQVDQLYSFELKEYADKLVARCVEEFKKQQVPYEIVILEGTPKHELINKFKRLSEDDLVICGATGIHSGIERIIFGSVSDNIVRQSACDVLVVRTKDKEI